MHLMIRILAIIVSLQILTASVILPKGDFGLLMQLPRMISEYKQLNGNVSVFDFCEEEFFDKMTSFNVEDEPADNPFEKEQKPVPIDMVVSGVYMLCYYVEPSAISMLPVVTKVENNTPYIENYRSTDLNSIFHPPETTC